MRYKKEVVFIGLLIVVGPVEPVSAAAIPLIGGLIDYSERAEIWDGYGSIDFNAGASQTLAENITVSYLGAFGSATNTAGSGQTAASTLVSANANQFGGSVSAFTDVTFDARLIKLHPDAPDDIGIPLFYGSSLSATDGALAELTIRAGTTLVQEQVIGNSLAINSSLSVLANEYIRIGIAASAASNDHSEIASASTPVFAIDPDFTVDFLGRTERAVDLYTLAVTPEIGFAGNFQTITPFTDGCLPDPSILTTSGAPSVTSGDTVTCQAIDPSGFRSYGNDPGDLVGILNELAIVVTAGATVETQVDDTETFGILGEDNALLNEGTISSTGANSEAVFFAGDSNEISNKGAIRTSGKASPAVFMEGDSVSFLNFSDSPALDDSEITTQGFQSSAVVLEGDDATSVNEGTITTTGDQSSGLVVEGLAAFMQNNGVINTSGDYSVGMTMLSINSERLRNEGIIETGGENATGILALGLNHDVRNVDLATTTAKEGQIKTRGTGAHGIALGLQEPVIPPGVEIPPGVFNAASGSITSSGNIETNGDEADAIHAFAHVLPVTNSGVLKTTGEDAHGISIIGEQATVTNEMKGNITAEGDKSFAIDVVGGATTITHINNSGALVGGVEGTASRTIDAGGIRLVGRGKITNEEGATLIAFGQAATGILNSEADNSEIINLGEVTVDSSISSVTGRGIDVLGDNVRVQNGARQTSTAPDDSSLKIIGDNSFGLRTAGTGATVSNGSLLSLDGSNNKGVEVEIQGNGSYWIDNDGLINLGSGPGNIAIHLRSANLGSNIKLQTASNSKPFCVGGPTGAQVLNCGDITLGTSASGLGIMVEGTKESFIENQASITGSGHGQIAMVVTKAPAADPADDQGNVITNFRDIKLTGNDTRGIKILGSGNIILNGTGLSAFDHISSARFDDEIDADFEVTITSTLDTQDARTDEHGTIENQAGTSLGKILVQGEGSIGLDIDGIGNLVGNRLDYIDSDADPIPNLPPESQPGFVGYSEIIATGAGSIGVRFAGNGNVLDNQGVIKGEAYSILGGSGDDIVQNKHRLVGNVDLGGGDDTFIQLGSSDNIEGVVEAGEGGGIDALYYVAPTASLSMEQSGAVERPILDGGKFLNFETAKINNGDLESMKEVPPGEEPPTPLPQGRAYLQNELVLSAADSGGEGTGSVVEIADTNLILEDGAALRAINIEVQEGGAISGNGSIGYIVTGPGSVSSTVTVAPGGFILPGSSPGTLEIFGDLELAGILEIEIGGTDDNQFDVLQVHGDLTLLESASFDIVFTDSFAPKSGDTFDFLIMDSLVGGLGLLEVSILGLQPGFEFDLALDQGGITLMALTDGVVPLPPAVWLFGSALIGLAALKRRSA